MDRQLINYLPSVVRQTKEMKAIMAAEQPEISLLWNEVQNALGDLFVQDATENGVARWERIMRIQPKAADTLDARKFRIIAKLNEFLPFTMKALERMLTALCGEDKYSIVLKNNIYVLQVNFDSEATTNYYEMRAFLDRIVPANLVIRLAVQHELPAVTVYVTGQSSSAIRKTVLDWDLFFVGNMKEQVVYVTGQNSGAIHKAVLDWDSFFVGGVKERVYVNSGIGGVYRRTVLN